MDHIETIRKNSGFLAIPLIWIACVTQYGTAGFQDDLIYYLFGHILVIEIVNSIIAISVGVFLLKAVVDYLEVIHFQKFVHPPIFLSLLVFGVGTVFYYHVTNELLFPQINIFWSYASLASGVVVMDDFIRLQNIRLNIEKVNKRS